MAACGTAASPAPVPATPAPATAASSSTAMGDIVETATAAGSFKTLPAAATAAGLVDIPKGAGHFTVSAPTDAAFAKLPAGTLDKRLADPAAVKKILPYHVVMGKVLAADVTRMTSATSVEGSRSPIAVKDGTEFSTNSAQVVETDILASNGVIHVIGSVILPPTKSLAPASREVGPILPRSRSSDR